MLYMNIHAFFLFKLTLIILQHLQTLVKHVRAFGTRSI